MVYSKISDHFNQPYLPQWLPGFGAEKAFEVIRSKLFVRAEALARLAAGGAIPTRVKSRYEMAVSIEDILARRTGLQLFSWGYAIPAAPHLAQCLADELGWSGTQKQEAVKPYVKKINRFLEVGGII